MSSRVPRWMRKEGWRTAAVLVLFLMLGPPGHPLPSSHAREGAAGAKPQQPQEWAQVERLIADQKFAEAAVAAEKLRQAAQKAGNRDEWTRALIKEVQLRTGLHGYETAVRFLKEQPWPDGLLNRAALNLFYARSLVNYYHAYSYEINQRERMDTRGAVDLKAWTKDQIYVEAQKAYEEVWKQRASLGAEPLARFGDFLNRNNYPAGIRSTLRDAVSYLYVELLSDNSLWTAEQSNEIYRLDLKTLLAGAQKELPLSDLSVPPLVKICYLTADLEQWHINNQRREAALEARLQRLEALDSVFSEGSDQATITTIVADLDRLLPGYRDVPWWAKGKATQAEFVRTSSAVDNQVRARAIAEAGWKAYPDSIGGKRCYSILKSIEAPSFHVSSMSADGPQKRSFEVIHANLPALYFRAYGFDLESRLQTARDYNLLPNPREMESLLATRPVVAEWSVNLPATPDYESHRTFVTPPMTSPGAYLVAASARKDFSKAEGNQISAFIFLVSDLVLLSRDDHSNVQVQALSGAGGKPIAGVTVDLYQYNWQQGHRRVAQQLSAGDGRASLAYSQDPLRAGHFLFARQGSHVALQAGYFQASRDSEPAEVRASLIYSDRSVYRPLQKVFWKVLAYGGRADQARYNTLPSTPVEISLIDPNGQVIDARTVTTGRFGSAAGEFAIPAGRPLGNWRLRSSLNGQATIKVEEYKRPTFEVTFKDPEAALRLNRPATFTGEVKYYFGLPVTSGAVKWRATREPVYPMWWGWYGTPGSSSGAQTVAAGTTALGGDGTFKITFTPEADERKAAESRDITYRYRVSADVTDEGGETRSASKTFRLGFVAVEASFSADTGFFRAGAPGAVTVQRTDLNGVPRAGKGTWRLVALQQPARTPLPAELPSRSAKPTRPGQKPGDDYSTPGDALRPRWDTRYDFRSVLRTWPDGAERAAGALTHNATSDATISLPALPAGAYRIHYQTTDDFGAACQSSWDFIVAGQNTPLALPAVLIPEKNSEPVGGRARFLALSGLAEQQCFFEVWRGSQLAERRELISGKDASLIEIPIREDDRGGISVRLTALRDHQLMNFDASVAVPFDNKQLKVEFATFRDKMRPGASETWRVTVKGPSGANVEAGAAELLSYMYDRSLDMFAPHRPPNPLGLYSRRSFAGAPEINLREMPGQSIFSKLFTPPVYPALTPDELRFFDNYGIGGPGMRRSYRVGGMVGGVAESVMVTASAAPAPPARPDRSQLSADTKYIAPTEIPKEVAAEEPVPLRSDFAETAFWRPQLLTGPDGSASIEFTVPDSVTSWNVWVHAVTSDLQSGSLHKEAQSVKELMVRPYLPRFLREGDRAELKVVVNNASDRELKGRVNLDILDPETDQSLLKSFGLESGAEIQPFAVAAGKGANLTFPITAPVKVGLVAFKVTAAAEDMSDGELRPLPLLPGRMHLAESRFVTLKNKDQRELIFERLRKPDDPSLVNEQMVVTVDAQLFYSVLSALPYLVNYPYECTEQTLNRFVSTGILSSLYAGYPAVAKMAAEFSKRDTPLETWDAADPNRKMALEETPWLSEARGGKDAGLGMVNVLDPRIARAEQESALAKLRKAQTANGAFPWWPGGPPSPYMTLYIMYGLAKASEFGVAVPKDMVQRGWAYLAQHYREEYAGKMLKQDCCWEFLTFLNYAVSSYPDPSWVGDALTAKERTDILNHCFSHWKQHSPYLKCQLALTLKRMNRPTDAALVFSSVMDSAQTTQDQGTFWAPEDRSWLWYNDTVETQAFALRTIMELQPADARRDGLVQWLFLNKKLNHWKSTRATSEVIYSLVHYLRKEGQLAVREDATVRAGGQTVQYVFEPDQYTGKKNQTVISGDKLNPDYANIVVGKEGPGFAFASATWQFSTEKLPAQGSGDFLSVARAYFKRESDGREMVLKPLAEGAPIQVGDQIEIHLSIRAQHPCEYVHLRDPRAAGLEPENAVSRFKWDLGIGWYEEVRDSGTNFFFEQLPQGEYTFKYRLRANMAGTFKVSPATLQSMYAPEFNAYSAGHVVAIR
jgi:uncharacterized protein YfaS (alpha-2-macroglobulin family)